MIRKKRNAEQMPSTVNVSKRMVKKNWMARNELFSRQEREYLPSV